MTNGEIKLYNCSFKVIKTIEAHKSIVYSLLSLKNRDFASASDDNTIKIWSPVGVLQATLNSHTGSVLKLVELKNGDIASSSEDGTIKIWTINGIFSLKRTLTGHTNSIWALAVLPNGFLISVSDNLRVKIWNAENDQLIYRFLTNSNLINSIKALPNGEIAIGYVDGKIEIANTSGAINNTLLAHSSHVWDMIILPNGDFASASADITVKIWTCV